MLNGSIDQDLRIHIQLEFIGNNGVNVEHELLFDTGFSEYLSLPRHLIDTLGYPEVDREVVTFGDGSQQIITMREGRISWDRREETAFIHCLEGEPLLGMQQVKGYRIDILARAGETVTFALMP